MSALQEVCDFLGEVPNLEVGVMVTGPFFSALREPLFDLVEEPRHAGACEACSPWETPTGFPAQKRAVAHGDAQAP